jgi:hypothetical protein
VAPFGKGELEVYDTAEDAVHLIGHMNSNVELTTTADGELWGMLRGTNPQAVHIDRSSAAIGTTLPAALGDITGDGLAFSSFGGAFYVFLLPHNSSTSVYRMSQGDGSLDRLLTKTGRRIISATVAVCL